MQFSKSYTRNLQDHTPFKAVVKPLLANKNAGTIQRLDQQARERLNIHSTRARLTNLAASDRVASYRIEPRRQHYEWRNTKDEIFSLVSAAHNSTT